MRFLRAFLPIFIVGVFTFLPFVAFGAETGFFGPIIEERCRCEGKAPDWGCVLRTMQNIVSLLVSLGVIVFVLGAAYAGWMFMTSAANPKNRESAKTMLWNV